ncbi:MAG: hypothetical protein Q7T19_03040 [Caulobacter sp.]|nr:hypothetical protein [Caulobacter sp.]
MTWMDRSRRTSFRATAAGLAMGWLILTALLTAWAVATAAVKDPANAFVGWPILFGIVGFNCLLGMVAIGPVWWLGHRIGLRTRRAAMTLGALAGGLFGLAAYRLTLSLPEVRDDREYELATGHPVPPLALMDGHLTGAGWAMAIQFALPVVFAGMLAAAVVWRFAYGAQRGGTIA